MTWENKAHVLKKDARYIAVAFVLCMAVGEGIAMQYMIDDSTKYGWTPETADWLFSLLIMGPVLTLAFSIPIVTIAGVIAAIKFRR